MFMEEGSSPVLAMPWCWVIEALARSELVDVSLLHELITKVPPVLGNLGKAAQDAAALKCLEGLLGIPVCSGDNHEAVRPSDNGHGYCLSGSCEDVLQCLLRETDNLQRDASEELKSEVHSFVKHRKTSLPRCTLDLLKNTILEGTHPFAASLMETSGLPLPVQRVSNYGVSMYSHDDDGQNTDALFEANKCSPRHRMDDQLREADCLNGTSWHSQRIHVQETNCTTFDVDMQEPAGKKLKLDKQFGMHSMQQSRVSFNGSKMNDDAKDKRNHQFTQANEMHDSRFYEDNVDGQLRTSAGKRNQPCNAPGEHHLEEAVVAMSKSLLSSTQYVFNEDFVTLAEISLCIKCNKGDQLLACSVSTCPLQFHESCLGCSVSYDDEGNYYCPICAYRLTISEYVRAKERVSSAMEELSLFIGGGNS